MALFALVAFLVYANAGINDQARRAFDRVERVDAVLRSVPLVRGAKLEGDFGITRLPRDARDARIAFRGARIGDGLAFWVYCGDQCSEWDPGDGVEVFRDYYLVRNGEECDVQRQLLRETAPWLIETAVQKWPANDATGTGKCSFSGCHDAIGVRLDLAGDDAHASRAHLWGTDGKLRVEDPPPAC